jgi:hypothetical protein
MLLAGGLTMQLKPTLTIYSHRSRFVWLLILMVFSAIIISARWKADSYQPKPHAEDSVQPEAELVTITPTGFEPNQINRLQGRFILAVDNRSGLDQVELYVERETGSRTDVQLNRKRKLAWREIIDLPAGRYVLRAINNDDWRCAITIRPR